MKPELRTDLEIAHQDFIPLQTSKAFNPEHDEYWEKISPEDLLWHTFEAHCNFHFIALFGVPNFDIELAHHRGISLKPLVEKIIQALSDPANTDQFDSFHLPFSGDIESYRTYLVKTLKFIDQLQPDSVNWTKVKTLKIDCEKITFNYTEDCRDVSFLEQLKTRQQLAQVLFDSFANLFKT